MKSWCCVHMLGVATVKRPAAFAELVPGTYKVVAERDGLAAADARVDVPPGATATVKLVLNPLVGLANPSAKPRRPATDRVSLLEMPEERTAVEDLVQKALANRPEIEQQTLNLRNDEITLAVHSERFCEALVASFDADVERSEEIDADRWRDRGPLHRVKELATAVGRLFIMLVASPAA